jgi:integrase
VNFCGAQVVRFAAITGWRLDSEVLPLTWDRVDFAAGEVRLHEGDTKNKDGRVFPMSLALRALLEEQHAKRLALTSGKVASLQDAEFNNVFFRMVADGRRGPKSPRQIKSITKAWRAACKAAQVPGRIPHDFRRTAARRLDQAGISRTVAKQMIGHKTDSMYERYRIVSAADLRDAASKLNEFVEVAKTTKRQRGGRRS